MVKLFLALIAVIALVGAVLAATGVMTVRNTEGETSIIIDKKELKEQAGKAAEKTKEAGEKAVDQAGQAVQKAKEAVRESLKDRPSTTTPPEAPSQDRARQADPVKGPRDGGLQELP